MLNSIDSNAYKNHIIFSEPIFPQSHIFVDTFLNEKIDVFSDKFTVVLPFSVADVDLEPAESISVAVKIGIDGAVCSDIACQFPKYPGLETVVKIDSGAAMSTPKFALPDLTEKAPKSETVPASQWADYSVWFALSLAFLVGLILNIMPCIWPILPIIVMRIVEQARAGRGKSAAMGLAFCLGILLFFAVLAGANIFLQLFYGTVLQWGDQLRTRLLLRQWHYCWWFWRCLCSTSLRLPSLQRYQVRPAPAEVIQVWSGWAF